MNLEDGLQQEPANHPAATHPRLILALVFCSGWAGLVYQLLWMKQLGLLFGNTAEATSTTLAAFFMGLAAGSWYWGRRAGAARHPLRLYAWLEVAIAATALVYYGTLNLFYWLYPLAQQTVAGTTLTLGLKFAIALALIFPPTFFMGGTVPVIAQWLIRRPTVFGRTSALLYGVNTLGAAVGVIGAAFVLVPALGFRLSYAVAVVVSASVGVVAWALARRAAAPPKQDESDDASDDAPRAVGLDRWTIGALCFLSGFGVLALEVLWTRMFAQVHSNSVYAFAMMLFVVLIGLALGAWISARLARLRRSPVSTLAVLIVMAGAALVGGPHLFMLATNGMTPTGSLEGWSTYMARLVAMGFAGIGVVVVALGLVFPFIMKVQEQLGGQPGRALGRLMALNTLGSILGALVCGFVMLPMLGMWATMRWIAVAYLIAALLVPRSWRPGATACRAASVMLLILLFTVLDPTQLTTTGTMPHKADARVVETWEGSDCTVTVTIDPRGSRAIHINSGYELGSTGAYDEQANQSRVPLYVFPQTRRVFYLGLGTGISAGEALAPQHPNVEAIVSAELVPQVITAAKTYIPQRMTRGVFDDPRSTILIGDGRHHLRLTDQRFDMINADLFLPYRRGAGSLYSLDHYRVARDRLTPDGVYVQWLPLFQLTRNEFAIIARTMIEAFGQVTMWRNNFQPGHEIVALVGQAERAPIPASRDSAGREMLEAVARLDWRSVVPAMATPDPATMTFYYAGNLTEARALFADDPINTDDRPLIEYQTPRTWRQNTDEKIIWFVGPKFADLVDEVFELSPPQRDPALADRTPGDRRLPKAGAAFHRSMVHKALGDFEASLAEWQTFLREWRAGAE